MGRSNGLTMLTHAGGCAKYPRHLDAVYMMEARDAEGRASFVKIGRSQCVRSRADCLQTDSPLAISILHYIEVGYADSYRLERFLLQRFSHGRVRGEWFRLEVAEVEWFRAQTRESLIEAMRAEMPRDWLVKHDAIYQRALRKERDGRNLSSVRIRR